MSPTLDDKIILVGATGILGRSMRSSSPDEPLVELGSKDLDPTNPAAVTRQIVNLRPRLILNCAADTDVEGAEVDDRRAQAVNVALARALAEAARETGSRLVHFSSTGCYGDWKSEPYVEDDPLRPTTAHHRSKADGETAVVDICPQALVLRLGWLFGGVPGQRKNFVWSRLQEAHDKAELGSNPGQYGCPTAASDVARQVKILLEHSPSGGVFNCVGNGPIASRLDYVKAIVAAGHLSTSVVPIQFPRRAPVSSNETAFNAALSELNLDMMSDWRSALAEFVRFQITQTENAQ